MKLPDISILVGVSYLLIEVGCFFCILKYVYDVVVKKFTFPISSPDKFLEIFITLLPIN